METYTPTPEEIKKIKELQQRLLGLIEIAQSTHECLLDLPSDDTETFLLYSNGLESIQIEIADITYDLNTYGGFEYMKQTYDMILNANFGTSYLDSAWDGIGNWASRDETIEDRITRLQKELLDLTLSLKALSKELQVELDNDIEWAHEKFKKEVADVSEKYKQIGIKLNKYGGFDLMQSSIYKVTKAGYSITVIEHAWDGIGNWLV